MNASDKRQTRNRNYELVYTSAEKGLQAGSKGFCTVAATEGISKPLADFLESISGYRHLFPPQSDQARLNPVVNSFVTANVHGKQIQVLSRICDAGLDYSSRSNKLAHHLVIDPATCPTTGPAWMISQTDTLMEVWHGQPRRLPTRNFAEINRQQSMPDPPSLATTGSKSPATRDGPECWLKVSSKNETRF